MLTRKDILPENVPFRKIDGAIRGQNCLFYIVESMIGGQNCPFYTSRLGKFAPNPYRMLTRLGIFVHICEIYKVDITFIKSEHGFYFVEIMSIEVKRVFYISDGAILFPKQ